MNLRASCCNFELNIRILHCIVQAMLVIQPLSANSASSSDLIQLQCSINSNRLFEANQVIYNGFGYPLYIRCNTVSRNIVWENFFEDILLGKKPKIIEYPKSRIHESGLDDVIYRKTCGMETYAVMGGESIRPIGSYTMFPLPGRYTYRSTLFLHFLDAHLFVTNSVKYSRTWHIEISADKELSVKATPLICEPIDNSTSTFPPE